MKMPQKPPDIQQGRLALSQPKYGRFFSTEPPDIHEYLHWDELRHRKPPGDLSHDEWWFALKMFRRVNRRRISLKDVSGQPFTFSMCDPIPEHLHHIDQDAAGQIAMSDQPMTNPEQRNRYIVSSLIEEAITSSQLEGAATTRMVAKEMIRMNRPPRDRSEQMILNNYAAMQEIQQIKDKPLSLDMLLRLHRIVTQNALDNPTAAGRFRRPDEKIDIATIDNEVLHTPPLAEELPERFERLCQFANAIDGKPFVHPVLRAIILHFWLAYDHPFVDGNGRCARALFYWSMLRQGYWLCEFLSISQIIRKAPIKYGRAFLYCETDENDLTYFILYHLDVIRKAIIQLREYVARKNEQIRQAEKLLQSSAGFNHRQLAILSRAMRHPDAEYTIGSHKTSHRVAYQTARTDLLQLAWKGFLVERKVGRKMVFRPATDLAEKFGRMK